jgi:glycosyltransferase involved in cell wall biosynthesis
VFAGTHSEKIGGLGQLDYDTMKEALRRARAYLYTGTQPASYTLGLIEAMMVGIPVVSIGPSWMRVFPYGSEMFEGHEIAGLWSNDELDARDQLKIFLREPEQAAIHGMRCRYKAIELFGKDRVKADWKAYLG